jgi:hypothetical protein
MAPIKAVFVFPLRRGIMQCSPVADDRKKVVEKGSFRWGKGKKCNSDK